MSLKWLPLCNTCIMYWLYCVLLMIVSEVAVISFFPRPLYQNQQFHVLLTHEMCSASHPSCFVLSAEPPYPQESAKFTK